jgi:hypothetical protein
LRQAAGIGPLATKGRPKMRLVLLKKYAIGAGVGVIVIVLLAFASSAAAGTPLPVSMTFIEPVQAQHCPGNCGSGVVIPYGHATEEIEFGAGCGGTCDLRRVDLADGSIYMDETASNFSCPGACEGGGSGQPFSADLSDVVIGGTGIFEGATGSLSGTVNGTGLHALVQLSGTITVAS